jgi:hypothetical protein
VNRGGTIAEQFLFGLVAGVAMAFATSIAFVSQKKFEELTLLVFMALVVSYIFKDRMKDTMKNYISILIQKVFPDSKTSIYSNLGNKIGYLMESFSFINEASLPQPISEFRRKEHLFGVDNSVHDENIMLYKKKIFMISKRFKSIFPDFQITGINDIIRMDISRFLSKMDNPIETVFIPKKDDYEVAKGSRVYHVNIIIKYSTSKTQSSINRFRLVLTRDGIKRIEEVILR